MGWLYLSLIIDRLGETTDPCLPRSGLFDMPGILVVFVSVVFVNSPTVFRIVRGLALDIKTRDYVAAAQTRGEGPWYIMLWEILPNARGPLIVDFCLRIGYTTILLGTLGFFGLGLHRKARTGARRSTQAAACCRSIRTLPCPGLALLSLVLGLNLLADGLREESLRTDRTVGAAPGPPDLTDKLTQSTGRQDAKRYDGPILEIDKLSISFFTRLREIPAVMDFSVTVQPGEAVGLVGESGCGKSTVALGVMQDLGENGRIVGGSIKFKGRDLGEMTQKSCATFAAPRSR